MLIEFNFYKNTEFPLIIVLNKRFNKIKIPYVKGFKI